MKLMNAQNRSCFTLIKILVIFATLVLVTAVGVVVWKEKVFPTAPPTLVATSTPSPTPPKTEAPPPHKEFGKTWVWTNPTQCLSNPWQRDWQQSHGDDASYPGGEEDKIIREYYQKQGVTIFDIISKSWETPVCMSCACPQGYTLYFLISNSDVDKMIKLGYQKTQ